jgi:CRISPR type III-A-associated RAMP protein Csm4
MKTVKLLLDDHAKFHFGDAAGELKDRFSSDQLVSALMNNIALLYGEKYIEAFRELLDHGEICFSSIFYGLNISTKNELSTKSTIYFFPRPKVDLQGTQLFVFSYKELKNVRYVSSGLFKKLSSSWNQQKEICECDLSTVVIIGKQFAALKEELAVLSLQEMDLSKRSLIKYQIKPGVAIDRKTNMSDTFYFEEFLEIENDETESYTIQPFMYFLYEGDLPIYLKAAIRLLADEGIGGKRSLGYGYFRGMEWGEDLQIPPKNRGYFVNLSVLYPRKEEVEKLYFYELEKRNGFAYSLGGKTIRKKSTMVISEGSLLEGEVQGRIVDVRPKGYAHPIYLYGKPLLIGFGGDYFEK